MWLHFSFNLSITFEKGYRRCCFVMSNPRLPRTSWTFFALLDANPIFTHFHLSYFPFTQLKLKLFQTLFVASRSLRHRSPLSTASIRTLSTCCYGVFTSANLSTHLAWITYILMRIVLFEWRVSSSLIFRSTMTVKLQIHSRKSLF